MPLYIRNDEVDQLVLDVMKLTGAKSKTEAVRQALLKQIDAVSQRDLLLERVETILARADVIGDRDVNFDMKAFTDDMWDGA